jgi:hypothetical protein
VGDRTAWRKDRRSGLYVPAPPIAGGAPLPLRIRAQATADSDGRCVLDQAAGLIIPGGPGDHWVITRMIAAVPGGQSATRVSDSFNRVVGQGWGTPNIGPPWVIVSGNGASVTGTVGQTTATNDMEVDPAGLTDADLYLQVPLGGVPAASVRINLMGRASSSANSGYGLEVLGSGALNSVNTVSLIRWDAGVRTILATVSPGAISVPITMHLRMISGVLSGSYWATTEPATPQVSAVDSTYSVGGVGFYRGGSGAGTVQVDNLLALAAAPTPIWDAYIGDPNQLANIIDSSVTAVSRWIPALVNGQPINPGDPFAVVATGMSAGAQAVLSMYLMPA